MKMTFIANACAIYESKGKKLLCDPWLVDGAFYGSWFHYPPLKTKPEDVADYDYLYISHLHPDHYCRETIKAFDKSKPAIIYDDQGSNFLEKIMLKDGFTNITKLKDKEWGQFGPFTITMFGPFTKHPFHDCQIGNIIDSAMLIEDDETTILNANDNTLSLEAARMMRDNYPKIDIAQLNYNSAGPYPSCFENLDDTQLRIESKRILDRQLEHMVRVANILQPEYVHPFAGNYIIGGKHIDKNRYLGTTTLEEACKFVRKAGLKALALNEGGDMSQKYERISTRARNRYIKSLEEKKYSYEDRDSQYSDHQLLEMIKTARKRMFQKQLDNMFVIDMPFAIETPYQFFVMNLKDDSVIMSNSIAAKPITLCGLPRVLLEDILDRKAHWNNAEIGCHIQFYREPNVYRPDFHTFMSFFHV